jgi:membrane protease YdiL (CAAX protease family)
MEPTTEQSKRARDWAAVLFALVLPTLVTLIYFVWAERFPGKVQQVTYVLAKAVQFGFPIVWVLCVQRCRPKPWPLKREGIWVGILFGLAVGMAMLAIYHGWLKTSEIYASAEGEIREKIAGMEIDSAWIFIGVGVFYSLAHSLLEEYYWRWFVFGQLKLLAGLWPAVVISSLGFMAHHVIVLAWYFGIDSVATWLFSFSIAIGGAIWAWLYHRTGSLLGPWLGHLLVDAAIFVIGYDIVRNMAAS